jgi:pyruvate dehydrogenase E2 component (dihydrolipoamide acetyltransferase)
VSSGDILAEIETDKATMEFEAVDEGVSARSSSPKGPSGVKVNTPIAVLLEEGESAAATSARGERRFRREEGPGRKGSSAAVAAPAPNTRPAGETDATETAGACVRSVPDDGERIFASPSPGGSRRTRASICRRSRARAPNGRIVKADVERAANPARPRTRAAAAGRTESRRLAGHARLPTGPTADAVIARMYAEDREYDRGQARRDAQDIAARLTEAKQTIPHFYLRRDIRLDALLAFRGQLNAKQLEARGVKLSVNDFIIKACALALQAGARRQRRLGGRPHAAKLKPSDVAVAVAVEGGLFTPVLKDAENQVRSRPCRPR